MKSVLKVVAFALTFGSIQSAHALIDESGWYLCVSRFGIIREVGPDNARHLRERKGYGDRCYEISPLNGPR